VIPRRRSREETNKIDYAQLQIYCIGGIKMNKEITVYRFLSSFVSVFTAAPGIWRQPLVIAILLAMTFITVKNGYADPTEIPFFGSANGLCIQCTGPWGRNTLTHMINGTPKHPDNFYSAEETIFSPGGEWTCVFWEPTRRCFQDIDNTTTFSFCLDVSGPSVNPVRIALLPNKQYTVNYPPPPCNTSSVSSFLGDNPKHDQSKRDFDSYLFGGKAGDELRLRLRPDRQGGNNEGEARLAISGGPLNDEVSGKLPLALDTVLPEDGEYLVTIEQLRNPGEERYRGGYSLRFNIPSGSPGLISPTNDVEK
jgi:hypothetical protein